MKKTLAIVLALVMVLCMIPAMSAGTEYKYDVTSQSYKVEGYAVETNADGSFKTWKKLDSGTAATKKTNSATIKYGWTDLETSNKVTTGKWTEDAVMVVVDLIGFKGDLDPAKTKVFVDGKQINPGDDLTIYKGGLGYHAAKTTGGDGIVSIPVEVTKAGFKDTMEVVLTGEYTEGTAENEATIKYTETAVMTLTFQNTDEYKVAKTATVVDIQEGNSKTMDAYIVGDKIYLDFITEGTFADDTKFEREKITVTFADENGKPFTATTWAYNSTVKAGKGFEVINGTNTVVKHFDKGFEGWKGNAVKLENSAANYQIYAGDKSEVKFRLETASSLYETKKYKVVCRYGVKVADPKGIYFAESTKTIKVGEIYTPVVMGVATNGAVQYDSLTIGEYSDKTILDYADDNHKTIIGVREGVAYITATYTYKQSALDPSKDKVYNANSMKIVVTEGESIPPAVPTTTTYVVSCRNLNVRKGAGTSYAKAGMVHRGDALEVVEIANNWAKLANGTYVCAKYIYKK